MREGKKRGWFSYSEISQLMESIEMMSVAQTLIMVCINNSFPKRH